MLARAVATLQVTRSGFPVEFVVVDHASRQPETAATLQRLVRDFPLRVVRAEGAFNFSRLVNLGRAEARGDYLFSVNDDIEACGNRWLGPLLRLLALPETGCVGPCLLYPDQRIQHAGVVMGMGGIAGHIGRLREWNDPHLPALLARTRQVTAVTGAFLGTSARNWDAAGGWSEALAVELNDVDFCLRMKRAGLRNIYCADSVLIHRESVSRGAPEAGAQWSLIRRDRDEFIKAHVSDLVHDDWYPPNLALRGTSLAPSDPPRRARLADMIGACPRPG